MNLKKLIPTISLVSTIFFTPNIIATTPKDEALQLFKQAIQSNLTGKKEEAIQLYTKALETDPQLFRVILINRAATYNEMGKTKEAVTDLDKLIAMSTSATEKHIATAVKHMEFKEYNKAKTELDSALTTADKKTDKSLSDIYSLQANVYNELAEPNSALEVLDKAIKLTPNDANLYSQRSETYEILKKPKESAKDLETFRKLSKIPE